MNFNIVPALSEHVSGIDMGSESLIHPNTDGTLVHRSGRIIFWMNDDTNGYMMSAIRELQTAGIINFGITITLTDNLDWPELEEYVFDGCALEALQHSLLSNAPDADKVQLKAYEPTEARDDRGYSIPPSTPKAELAGHILSTNNRRNVMKLLQVTFQSMRHNFFENKHE